MGALFQELLAATPLARDEVDIPEWKEVLKGKKLYLKKMGVEERDAWEAANWEKRGDDYEFNDKNLRARLLYRCLVDEEGNKLFPSADSMSDLDPDIAIPLFERAKRMNKIGKNEIEELAKNSDGGLSAASGSN